MHRFWEIDELVRTLATDLKWRNTYGSAIALACCSKRLGDIVLDSLWEHLNLLGRLMRCLPPETWEIRDQTFVSTADFGPFVLGAYWSIVFFALPHHQGMDPILNLFPEGTRARCVR